MQRSSPHPQWWNTIPGVNNKEKNADLGRAPRFGWAFLRKMLSIDVDLNEQGFAFEALLTRAYILFGISACWTD